SEKASLQVPIAVKTDTAHFTRFVGSLADSQTNEAWLFDRWNKRDLVIREGDRLEVADISVRLKKVESNQLHFERNGEIWVLELGHDVREIKPLETAETAQGK